MSKDNDGWDDIDQDDDYEEAEEGVEDFPAVELDPEDPISFPEQFYTVQSTYEHEGMQIPAGTEIQIKCGNCAAWNAPLKARGGKPLCTPGLPFLLPAKDGEEPTKWRMQEDRYSCQTHFIPKDMEDVLQHFTDDLDQVKLLLWAFPTIVQFVKLQNRVRRSKKIADSEKAINNLIDFIVLFSSEQQQQLVKPFIKQIVQGLVQTKRVKRSKTTTTFKAGDLVSWEVRPGVRAEGVIRSIGGRGKMVTILVSAPFVDVLLPGSAQNTIQWQRPAAEWKELKPQLVESVPIITDQDD